MNGLRDDKRILLSENVYRYTMSNINLLFQKGINMKKYARKSLNLAVLGLSMAVSGMKACEVIFTNDSANKIFLVDRNFNKAYEIGRGKKITFGDAHTKAKVCIFIKKPHARYSNLTYQFTQRVCAKDGKPHLKLSDLDKNTGDAKLFDIKKIEPQADAKTKKYRSCASCRKH